MSIKYFSIILISSITLLSSCECLLPNYYSIFLVNNAYYDTYYQILDNEEYKICYPDTTIFFSKRLGLIKAKLYFVRNIGLLPIENYFDKLPSDTLSVFYFHPDTLAKYSWEEIQRDYNILQRYDLSIADIKMLYRKSGVPEIPYPPDERMKDMKMYPPYGSSSE